MTKAKATRLADKLGFNIEDDGTMLMVSSKTPRHDGTGCHELCTEIDRFETKAEAWKAVIEDITGCWVSCEIADCEWCN